MKTIPSLVASSTVGIAATGLALGKPERGIPSRPTSRKRKVGELADLNTHRHGTSSPLSRPGTSSTMITPESKTSSQPTSSSPNPPSTDRSRPPLSRIDFSSNNRARKLSILRYGDPSSPIEYSGEESRRDSVSSRGSWIRRLSTIPNSYNNSPRSSVGPDSPSLTFSHASAAPILSDPAGSAAQLPPNKLVKRATSGKEANGSISKAGFTSQVPTLRRPATSHQRSVTLQQQFKDDSGASRDVAQQTPSHQAQVAASSNFSTPERIAWRPYFQSRPTKLTKERLSGKSMDGNVQDFHSTSRRVIFDDAVIPTLVSPLVINTTIPLFQTPYKDILPFDDSNMGELGDEHTPDIPSTDQSQMLSKRPRRSLSLHFSSPGSWITRSGSLRKKGRNAEVVIGGKRHVSAPVSTMPGRSVASAHGPAGRPRDIMDPAVFERLSYPPSEVSSPNDPYATSFNTRSRNTSSPLPPLSRLSSFNVDLARLGLSSSSSSAPRRSPTSRVMQSDTTSTSGFPIAQVADNGSRVCSSGDDEMDFQSDTVFDSLRSGATGSTRSRNTPLGSMFDESPPSVNGHSRSKRLSIHEILENEMSERHNRIIEEDEGMSTPVKGPQPLQDEGFQTPIRHSTDSDFPSSPPSFCLATKDFGRLSLDDTEEDEDWTRDDDMDVNNQLYPPSGSINHRRVSSNVRTALADVTHTNGNPASTNRERPKSNLFDWSEPSSAEKLDFMGNSQRPQTAHVKQMADSRGGRALGRHRPSALHIRSQSVPVIPDGGTQRDHAKLTPKFGTWGLGAKGVSEDWDNDFEFESSDGNDGEDGDSKMESSGMLIPQTIQASQENVLGHVGHIREVCLLVEDLKRLRLLAKEKGLLHGSSSTLWKEAEGIIALAVPDEEDMTLSPTHSPSSAAFDREKLDNRHNDTGLDVAVGRHRGLAYDTKTVRRRSVFSPDDDIFGAGLDSPPTEELLLPPANPPTHFHSQGSSEVARSVMENMHQHRAISDPLLKEMSIEASNKMPFDTTSLRDLVHRANVLSRTLGDIIRKADGKPQSPEASPRRDSSPAFTRVFTDPMANPTKHLPTSRSNNSILSGSIDTSPTRNLGGQRMHMMTVV
ncbi:Uncharacterized protein BP5553_01753 [Venustampulla echinocandica]|uniref:Uncharacterized protein n=1 Tax=Venustampulla echinocandica TaxID=2656787 RepID=A0A370U1X1_9HELO|nr:Uncharacterized protein BP5553_01753 [Venustampulla echinocandica]RDL41774.1 Uncharacterized protein BP5553_01753 [Venustampulla echinocandica]